MKKSLEEMLAAGEYDDILEELDSIIDGYKEDEPVDINVLLDEIVEYSGKKDFENAEKSLLKAYEIVDKSNVKLMLSLDNLKDSIQKGKESVQESKRLENFTFHLKKVIEFVNAKKNEDALDEVQKALEYANPEKERENVIKLENLKSSILQAIEINNRLKKVDDGIAQIKNYLNNGELVKALDAVGFTREFIQKGDAQAEEYISLRAKVVELCEKRENFAKELDHVFDFLDENKLADASKQYEKALALYDPKFFYVYEESLKKLANLLDDYKKEEKAKNSKFMLMGAISFAEEFLRQGNYEDAYKKIVEVDGLEKYVTDVALLKQFNELKTTINSARNIEKEITALNNGAIKDVENYALGDAEEKIKKAIRLANGNKKWLSLIAPSQKRLKQSYEERARLSVEEDIKKAQNYLSKGDIPKAEASLKYAKDSVEKVDNKEKYLTQITSLNAKISQMKIARQKATAEKEIKKADERAEQEIKKEQPSFKPNIEQQTAQKEIQNPQIDTSVVYTQPLKEEGEYYPKSRYEKEQKKNHIDNFVIAREGNVHRYGPLGKDYFYGKGCNKNYALSVYWGLKALKSGEYDSWNLENLAECFDKGLGVEPRPALALRYYRRVYPNRSSEWKRKIASIIDRIIRENPELADDPNKKAPQITLSQFVAELEHEIQYKLFGEYYRVLIKVELGNTIEGYPLSKSYVWTSKIRIINLEEDKYYNLARSTGGYTEEMQATINEYQRKLNTKQAKHDLKTHDSIIEDKKFALRQIQSRRAKDVFSNSVYVCLQYLWKKYYNYDIMVETYVWTDVPKKEGSTKYKHVQKKITCPLRGWELHTS